jgi:hypothetical protein
MATTKKKTETTKPTPKVVKELKVGCTVKVKKGSRNFNGGHLAPFVYDQEWKVKSINVDRVIITYEGTAVAVRKSDLTVV